MISTIRDNIVAASFNGDVKELQRIQMDLYKEKMKMDKFFTYFLEKFERKMDPENVDTPIWNLYRTKTKEYSQIDDAIRTTKYYLSKHSGNV